MKGDRLVTQEESYKHLYDEYANRKGQGFSRSRFEPVNAVGFRNYIRQRACFKQLQLKPTDKFLDIGCASGLQVKKAAKLCEMATGVDIADEFIRTAKIESATQSVKNTRFIQADSKNLPLENESFTKILMAEILDHVIDPKIDLTEAFRVAQNGAHLILTVPYKNHNGSIWGRIKQIAGSRFSPLPEFSVDAWMNHGDMHVREFDCDSLTDLVEETGWKVNSLRVICHVDFPQMPRIMAKLNRFMPIRNAFIAAETILDMSPGMNRLGEVLVLTAKKP